MKNLRRKRAAGNRNIRDLPLISPAIILSAKEIAAGYTVVEVPLTAEDRQRLDNGVARTGEDVRHVVRDALRIADITSEEQVTQGNQLLTRDTLTREIRALELWPKKTFS